jgi:hypothetical protein
MTERLKLIAAEKTLHLILVIFVGLLGWLLDSVNKLQQKLAIAESHYERLKEQSTAVEWGQADHRQLAEDISRIEERIRGIERKTEIERQDSQLIIRR